MLLETVTLIAKNNLFKTLAITNLQMTDKFSANILLTLVLLKVILELLYLYTNNLKVKKLKTIDLRLILASTFDQVEKEFACQFRRCHLQNVFSSFFLTIKFVKPTK